eukprot:g12127.t1
MRTEAKIEAVGSVGVSPHTSPQTSLGTPKTQGASSVEPWVALNTLRSSFRHVADDSRKQLVVCRLQQPVVVAAWGPCHALVPYKIKRAHENVTDFGAALTGAAVNNTGKRHLASRQP